MRWDSSCCCGCCCCCCSDSSTHRNGSFGWMWKCRCWWKGWCWRSRRRVLGAWTMSSCDCDTTCRCMVCWNRCTIVTTSMTTCCNRTSVGRFGVIFHSKMEWGRNEWGRNEWGRREQQQNNGGIKVEHNINGNDMRWYKLRKISDKEARRPTKRNEHTHGIDAFSGWKKQRVTQYNHEGIKSKWGKNWKNNTMNGKRWEERRKEVTGYVLI